MIIVGADLRKTGSVRTSSIREVHFVGERGGSRGKIRESFGESELEKGGPPPHPPRGRGGNGNRNFSEEKKNYLPSSSETSFLRGTSTTAFLLSLL